MGRARGRLLLALLVLPSIAAAQLTPAFPADAAWIAVTKGQSQCSALFDAPLDTALSASSRDLVNADEVATHIWGDDGFLYFRLRVDGSPNAPSFNQLAWGCQLSTDGDSSDYEWMVYLDGRGEASVDGNAVVRVAQAPAGSVRPSDAAFPLAPFYAGATHARAVSDGSGDFFVDFAVLRERVGFPCEAAPATLVCGANSNASPSLTTGNAGDIAGVGNVATPSWAQVASCAVTFPGRCEAGGQLCGPNNQCVDCLDDNNCPSDPLLICVNGSCVGCAVNTDCDLEASPTCTNGSCGPCTDAEPGLQDFQCVNDDNGPQIDACHELTGQCVECRNDGHCADNGVNGVCDASPGSPSSSTCVECNVNAHCTVPGLTVCDTNSHVCVAPDSLFADGFES